MGELWQFGYAELQRPPKNFQKSRRILVGCWVLFVRTILYFPVGAAIVSPIKFLYHLWNY
ncbi:MAG: hypothetical protein IJW98_01665 [Clostridia bacterium]|nr:hypothetical protein [Clostridia bacterium]